ncbi:MAG: dipeptidase [Candidatus Moranbacteria bacterium]|nr:dipeptidase [Candidatus Moranbacteria bacterium]
MKKILLPVVLIGLTISFSFSKDFKKIHSHAIVVDTHNDVLMRAVEGEDLSFRTVRGHCDLIRLKEGGVDVQIFSIWCGENYGKGTAFARANQILDTLNSLVLRNPNTIAFAHNEHDLRKILHQKKLAALIGVEGGHMIEDSLFYLDSLAKRGMNYLTLTWNNSTSWATSAADETEHGDSLAFKGLTDFGKQVIQRLNKLGVMVDLSHVGEKTFWDAIAVAKKPVIVSHSSVYAICPQWRNLKDDQIKAVAKNNGVICVNFYSGFLDSTFERKAKAIKDSNKIMIDSITQLYTDHHQTNIIIDSLLKSQFETIRPPLSLLIDHIDYLVKLAGINHVGIGSDFDGVESVPQEMDDVTFLPNITRELLRRGYTEKQIDKILGGNVLRVLKANWRK